jgi:hypothetical protein
MGAVTSGRAAARKRADSASDAFSIGVYKLFFCVPRLAAEHDVKVSGQ